MQESIENKALLNPKKSDSSADETIPTKKSTLTKTHQSINSNTIFARKNSTVFSETNDFVKSPHLEYLGYDDICRPVISALSYASLLFTMTIGTGISTAIDMYKRNPLLLTDIQNMCETLEYLDTAKDNNTVDEIAEAINQYPTQTNSRSKLQIELANMDLLKESRIKYKLDNISELNEQIRSIKVKLILDYLAAPYNAGKELQHHIFDILHPISEKIKSKECASHCLTSNVI